MAQDKFQELHAAAEAKDKECRDIAKELEDIRKQIRDKLVEVDPLEPTQSMEEWVEKAGFAQRWTDANENPDFPGMAEAKRECERRYQKYYDDCQKAIAEHKKRQDEKQKNPKPPENPGPETMASKVEQLANNHDIMLGIAAKDPDAVKLFINTMSDKIAKGDEADYGKAWEHVKASRTAPFGEKPKKDQTEDNSQG